MYRVRASLLRPISLGFFGALINKNIDDNIQTNLPENTHELRFFLKQNALDGKCKDGFTFFFNSFSPLKYSMNDLVIEEQFNILTFICGHGTSNSCKNWLIDNFNSIILNCFKNMSHFLTKNNQKSSNSTENYNENKAETQNVIFSQFYASAISESFYLLDYYYFKFCNNSENYLKSGASITSIIHTSNGLYIVSLGDNIAIIGMKSNKQPFIFPIVSSNIHTTQNYKEIERIQNTHPNISIESILDDNKYILGEQMTTRSIGDYHLKDNSINISKQNKFGNKVKNLDTNALPYISCLPDIYIHPLNDENVEFMLIGSNYFWELMSFQEAVELTHNFLNSSNSTSDYTSDNEVINNININLQNPATLLLRKALLNLEPIPKIHRSQLLIDSKLYENSGLKHLDMSDSAKVYLKAQKGDFHSQDKLLLKIVNKEIKSAKKNAFSKNKDISIAIFIPPKNQIIKNKFIDEKNQE